MTTLEIFQHFLILQLKDRAVDVLNMLTNEKHSISGTTKKEF